jgi:hypothetical protein
VFPLHRKDFPDSAAQFAEAMEASLRHYVRKDAPLVSVSARVFPYLDEIVINLDGARIDSTAPAPVRATAETKEACEAALVTLSARDILVQDVPISVRMEMRDIVFHKSQDENGEVLLIVRKARQGHVIVSAAQLDLENVIAETARALARKNGIAVENVRLALRARGARSLAADVQLHARKFMMRAKIDIYGQLDITDDFVARVSQLKCRGDGAIASLACGALEPHLQKLNGATFPLMSLPLGEIQLRDVRIAVADTVEITADFGTAES